MTIAGICRGAQDGRGHTCQTRYHRTRKMVKHRSSSFLPPSPCLIFFCWQRSELDAREEWRAAEDNATPSAWVAPELVNCGDSFIIVSQSLSVGDSAASPLR